MSQRYRVTHVPHYIGSRLVHPDKGDDSIVTLPANIKPGRWLVPLDAEAKAPVVGGSSEVAAFMAKHIAGGSYAVVQVSDGSRASRLFKKTEEGGAQALAEAEAKRLNDGGEIELEQIELSPTDDATHAGDGTNLPDA